MTSRTIPLGDAVALTRALVAVDSRNPLLVPNGPGEQACAEVLAHVLTDWGLRVELQESATGRANVIARGGARDGGRSLLLNGHLDTVGVEGMTHAPWEPTIRDGRLYGRGSTDMKSGVAAMCAAAALATAHGFAGEVIVTAVTDEEFTSLGTKRVIESGIRADAAIVTEPTRLAICPAHRGFAWGELVVHGVAAHGSRYDLGVDAITLASLVVADLDVYQRETLTTRMHPLLGRPSLHASFVTGGIGSSTYPDRCDVQFERRTIPGEGPEDFARELRESVARVQQRRPELRADVRVDFSQGPNDIPASHPIVLAIADGLAAHRLAAPIEGLSCWTDAALLSGAGIPAVCFGPGDIGLAHAAEEYVMVHEIEQAAAVLQHTVRHWCGVVA